jgi:hypothetical protein
MDKLPVLYLSSWEFFPEGFTGIVLLANGDKHWYLNGERHREDGPAEEYANGDKFWYLNGKLHREDGPAAEIGNNVMAWYFNGKYVVTSFKLKVSYVVLERGIPTDKMFGGLKVTQAKLLTAEGIIFIYDNLPGMAIEG